MGNINLSLEGILDYRWELKEIGDGKIKLCYNSMKGIPTIIEAEKAIGKVLETKGLDNIYISGINGDVMIEKKQLKSFNELSKKGKSITEGYDPLSDCFGAEEDLLRKEERGIV